jgi:hypothetical protein
LTLVASADTHLSEQKNEQRTAFGDAARLLVSGVTDARAHSLVNFALSSIPSGQRIQNATLRLVLASAAAGERTLAVSRVGRAWEESKATWVRATTMPVADWTMPGGDAALVPSDTKTLTDEAKGAVIEFALTADLQALASTSTKPGNGWLLTVAPEQQVTEFSSRESLFEDERPELLLELCP